MVALESRPPEKDALPSNSYFTTYTVCAGFGVEDIATSTIRNPLHSKEKFAGNLLRFLHLIRFASHFDFTMVQKAWPSMKLPEYHGKQTPASCRYRL